MFMEKKKKEPRMYKSRLAIFALHCTWRTCGGGRECGNLCQPSGQPLRTRAPFLSLAPTGIHENERDRGKKERHSRGQEHGPRVCNWRTRVWYALTITPLAFNFMPSTTPYSHQQGERKERTEKQQTLVLQLTTSCSDSCKV